MFKRKTTKDTEASSSSGDEGEQQPPRVEDAVEVQNDDDGAVVVQQEDQEVPSSDARVSVKDRVKHLEGGDDDDDSDDDDDDDLECKPTETEEDDSSSAPSITSILQRKELMNRLSDALIELPRELREEAVDRFVQDVEDARERAIFVRPLLMHSYHLPGYNWRQDWWQYLSNNHPLFGIWCHHRHHPLKAGVRAASLIGSVLFGLAITNIIYLAFVFTQNDPEQEYFTITTNVTRTGLYEDLDQNISTLSVTSGNIALWTVGAMIHGFYDNCIWALAACSCLVPQEGSRRQMQEERLQRYRSSGAFLVNLATIVVVAIATFACMLRAALQADESGSTEIIASHQLVHGELQKIEQNRGVNFQDYEFVVSYLVELLLNYIVYYPLVGTLLFSGILNVCGRSKFPLIGGRPYELRQLQEKSDSELDLEEGIEVEWNDEQQQEGMHQVEKKKMKGDSSNHSKRNNNNNKEQEEQEEEESESCTGSADTTSDEEKGVADSKQQQ